MSEREALAKAFSQHEPTEAGCDAALVCSTPEHLAEAALAHIAAVLRDEATVEAVANYVPLGFTERDPYRNTSEAATAILAVIADRLGASQPREVATGGDASTTVDPDATTTEGDL